MSHTDPEMNGPEMNEIEAALAAWTPRFPQLDRDRLMFAAGEASRSPASCSPVPWAGHSPLRYLWPLATSLSTAAALFMAFLLAQDRAGSNPAAVGTPSIASAPEVAPQADRLPTRWELPQVADGTYLALRNRMLTRPADEWSVAHFTTDGFQGSAAAVEDDAAHKAPTRRNLLREFLPPEIKPIRVRRGSPDPAADSPAAQTDQPQEAIS